MLYSARGRLRCGAPERAWATPEIAFNTSSASSERGGTVRSHWEESARALGARCVRPLKFTWKYKMNDALGALLKRPCGRRCASPEKHLLFALCLYWELKRSDGCLHRVYPSCFLKRVLDDFGWGHLQQRQTLGVCCRPLSKF